MASLAIIPALIFRPCSDQEVATVSDMGGGKDPTPDAGVILSLHADHRRGLHATRVDGCIQCLFERLDEDAAAAASSIGAIEDTAPDSPVESRLATSDETEGAA